VQTYYYYTPLIVRRSPHFLREALSLSIEIMERDQIRRFTSILLFS